jgi:nitrate reductase cytochrome c-type subunit
MDKLNNPGIGLTYPYLAIEQRDDKYWRDRTAQYVQRLGKDQLAAKVKTMQPNWERAANQQLADAKAAVEAAKTALKSATPETKSDLEKALATAEDRAKRLQEKVDKKDFAEQRAHFESTEVYATDAFRLLTNRQLCLQCHSVGSFKSADAKGPNLELAAERLRPEWTMVWIANPTRMFTYVPNMPQNFLRNSNAQYNEFFVGSSLDKIRALRDVLLDLPRLIEMAPDRSMSSPAVAAGGH